MRQRSTAGGLIVVLAGLLAPSAGAQSGQAADWLNPRFGRLKIEMEYQTRVLTAEPLAGQRGTLGFVQHRYDLRFPLYQDEQNEWSLNGRFGVLDSDSSAVLPRQGFGRDADLPNNLWDIALGATYRHKFDTGQILGGNLTIGSPSDRPFQSLDVVSVQFNGFWCVPTNEDDAWVVFVNFSNTRAFAPFIPLPGVGYELNRPRLNALIGLPFAAARWEPVDRLTFEGRYFVPWNLDTRVSYRLLDNLKIYTGFIWDNQQWLRYDRHEDNHRLFFFEQRLMAGLRWDVMEDVYFDLSGGWGFDRFFFEAREYDDRNDSRIDISDGPVFLAQVGVRL